MIDERGRLLVSALGFAGCSMLPYDRALHALRSWLDSWSGLGHVRVGMHRQGFDLQLTQYDDPRLARDLLHDRHGALPDERDGHHLGAHAAAGGVGGVEEGRRW